MFKTDDYETMRAEIEAIANKDIKHPHMPVGIFLQEAEDLHLWATADKAALTAVGMDWSLVEKLPQWIDTARWAQSQWNSARLTEEDAQTEYSARSSEAYELHDQLLHAMLFAYRKHPNLMATIRAISKGTGDADMFQDLSDLAAHGKNNPEPLTAINLDMTLLDKAATLSDSLATLLAAAHSESAMDKQFKLNRDKSYTLAKRAVDEIREYGRYVFRRDPARRVGYASDYHRNQNRQPRA